MLPLVRCSPTVLVAALVFAFPLIASVSGEGWSSATPLHSALQNESVSASSEPTVFRPPSEYLDAFVKETTFYNDLVLFFLPSNLKGRAPHAVMTWIRNYVAGCAVYFLAGGIWSFYIYTLKGSHFFQPEAIPSREAIVKQIVVSMKAMPLYVTLPTLSEYLVENGYTRCYSGMLEHGLALYLLYAVLYWSFVEFWIYWMHRWLHEIKPLYRYFHAVHHIYNKQNTLSPFASLAFHPIDGIIQACPHLFALFLIPTHFTTHLALLFLEGLWTTNIHDNIDENIFPIMGAAYHTIHHTTYKHNYGHYTIIMDYLFGTLCEPERPAASKKRKLISTPQE